MNHKLDTNKRVFFYEQEFYVLSNFSAFCLLWRGELFYTSEAAYHWEKFPDNPELQIRIQTAVSAHEAFRLAYENRELCRADWKDVRVSIMKSILQEKFIQHEYVRRKLLETGDRELIEDSWRDDFWGWGANKNGQNQLGKLWMEIRDEFVESHKVIGEITLHDVSVVSKSEEKIVAAKSRCLIDCEFRKLCEEEFGKFCESGDDFRAVEGTHYCRLSWKNVCEKQEIHSDGVYCFDKLRDASHMSTAGSRCTNCKNEKDVKEEGSNVAKM